jgi:hypothetical protein
MFSYYNMMKTVEKYLNTSGRGATSELPPKDESVSDMCVL